MMEKIKIKGEFITLQQLLKVESIISLIIFLSGLQTLFIGIVGEYIGKIYFETKKRPRYIIEENLMDDGRKWKIGN